MHVNVIRQNHNFIDHNALYYRLLQCNVVIRENFLFHIPGFTVSLKVTVLSLINSVGAQV